MLSVQTTNRRQNSLKQHLINSQTQKANLILDEKSNTYVNVRNTLTFLKDNSFIWQSDQDGFDHLYHYNADGKLRNQITKGKFDKLIKWLRYNVHTRGSLCNSDELIKNITREKLNIEYFKKHLINRYLN